VATDGARIGRHVVGSEKALDYLRAHGARVELVADFLASDEATLLLEALLSEIEFASDAESRVRRPFSSERVAIPRRQSAYGEPGTHYRFAGCTVAARPWLDSLAQLRERVSERAGTRFDFVLVNHYRSGHDCIGWHRDDEADLGARPDIASLSLGATRDFQLRHRDAFPRRSGPARRPDLATVTLPLAAGSLLLLRHPTNHEWMHQLPRRGGLRAGEIPERLNLTWRRVGWSD